MFCGSAPLAFTFWLGGLLLFPMRVGAATCLEEKPVPETLLERVAAAGVTVRFTAPTGCRYLADERQSEYVADGWNLTGDAFVVVDGAARLAVEEAALCAELQAFVKRRIAPYKYPRAIEFVERLPRTGTGQGEFPLKFPRFFE